MRAGPGRLFWKLFLGFWATLLVTGLAVGLAVRLHEQQRQEAIPEPVLAAGPRAEAALSAAAATLRYGGEDALRALLGDEDAREGGPRFRVLAVNAQGHELLDRPVPAAALALARERIADGRPGGALTPDTDPTSVPRNTDLATTSDARGRPIRGVRAVSAADGRAMLLLAAFDPDRSDALDMRSPASGGYAGAASRQRGRAGPPGRQPPIHPALAIGAGLLASLVFSALLAGYLTRPIRHLREGFAAVAGGRLDARVTPAMGRRADELADLGRAFDDMTQRLNGLIQSQRRLLHDVSHELRSPLARMQAAVGLLRRNPARADAMIERIDRETQRLDALVGEVLAMARLEAIGDEAPATDLNLATMLAELAEDASFEADGAGLHLQVHDDSGGTPLYVSARGHWLQRAVENVLRNAIRHSPADGEIELRLARIAPGKALVEISDRGPGVSADELERIFEPFQRGSSAGHGDGHGLGLTIARRAVLAHGGMIAASLRAGGGLTVRIELPLRDLKG